MRSHLVQLDLVSFNSLLTCQRPAWRRCLETALQLQGDAVTMNAVLASFPTGRWSVGTAWLAARPRRPTAVTLTAMLAWCHGGRWDLALRLGRKQLRLSTVHLNAAATACEKAQRWPWTLRIVSMGVEVRSQGGAWCLRKGFWMLLDDVHRFNLILLLLLLYGITA